MWPSGPSGLEVLMIDSWAKEEEEEPKPNEAQRAASWDDASQTGANPTGGSA